KQNKTPAPNYRGQKPEQPAKDRTDLRAQLYNDSACGPIEQVQLPHDAITLLRGIPLDIDPRQFRLEAVPPRTRKFPDKFYGEFLRTLLERHPVLKKAEVRNSGQGLHVIVRFTEPIVFNTEGDRQRWARIV